MNLDISTTMVELADDDLFVAMNNIKTSLEDLDMLVTKLDDESISTEGLKELFTTIANTFKATKDKIAELFKLSKTKYKTDLDRWVKKEQKTIELVETLDFENVKDIKVDYPTGLKGKYIDSVELISEIFKGFKSAMQIELVSKTTDTILSSVSKNSTSHEVATRMADKSIENSSKHVLSVNEKLNKQFVINPKIKDTKPFKDLFGSIEELAEVRKLLEEINIYVGNVNNIETQIKAVEDSLELCSQFIMEKVDDESSDYIPSKEFLNSFSSFIKKIDNLFVIYGSTTIRTLAINHNLSYVYSELLKQKKV
jgi:DNA-binding SARP family transcriptional activator